MSELQTIEKTKTLITKAKIIDDLRKLGVMKDDNIIMHVSLSSMGWIVGGAVTLLEAVITAIGPNGTLVMATHTSDNSNPAEWENPPVPKSWIETIKQEMPAFDVNDSPVRGIGVTSEVFRKMKGVKRSNHPQGSFCALGKNKNEITANHVLTPQFGMDTPLGALYSLDAKILLIGVDYERCTSLHLAEVLANKNKLVEYEAAIKEKGERKWITFMDYNYDVSNFNKVGKLYEAKHKEIGLGYVGQAYTRLINMKNLVDFAVYLYKN